MKKFGVILTLLCFSVTLFGKNLNPLDYGLDKANNGVERYEILRRCHADAIEKGYGVSYKGIKKIYLELPQSAESIPLSYYTDFAGAKIEVVNNTVKRFFLFEMTETMSCIDVRAEDIDNGSFESYPGLQRGQYLVVAEDLNIWSKRRGYDSHAMRKDAFFVIDGLSSQRPIYSYNSKSTRLKVSYCKVASQKKVVRDLSFVRPRNTKYMTFLFSIENQYNLEISNINIYTPEIHDFYGDVAIRVQNCVNVKLQDVTIEGTYSQTNNYGYGIYMHNVNGLTIKKMYARANWGVFGTFCLQNVSLRDCDINRFDIHCYGKNIKATRCNFEGMYNQFSSIYGTLEYKKCTFKDFTPVLIESSYNAYTPFDIIFKNCTFNIDKKHNYLITLFGVPKANNERPELLKKSLPNIEVKNCTLNIDDDTKIWHVVYTHGDNWKGDFDYISHINIAGLKLGRDVKIEFFSEKIKTVQTVQILQR